MEIEQTEYGAIETKSVGPYMLQELVDELPLDTGEREGIEITCVEAWEGSFYVGTSAHEILHFVSLPPSAPSTPHPTSSAFPSQKPTYILASRIQPPTAAASASRANQHYIQQIILLPGPSKVLVLSSTGLLSFWTYPELSPALGGTVKVKDTNFIGGLDINEFENEDVEAGDFMGSGQSGGRIMGDKMVMVLGKKHLKMVKVREEELRLVKNIECPNLVLSTRRGPIACVATETDYALLHVENIGRIPLFPILSSNASPISPAQESSSLSQEYPPTAPTPSRSPRPPSASESDTDGPQVKSLSRRTSSSSASSSRGSHPPRNSSLQQRPRSEVFSSSTIPRLSAAEETGKHSRSISTGSIRGGDTRGRAGGKASPLGRGTSTPTERRAPQDEVGRKPTPSPTSSARGSLSKATGASQSQSQLAIPPRTSRSGAPSRSTTPTPAPTSPARPASQSPTPKPRVTPPKTQQLLKPHIVSPTPQEFLLTTGTSQTDPGVGMFVDINGDPTRGTISFSRYPDEILLDGGWVIALQLEIDGSKLEVVPWSEEAARQNHSGGPFIKFSSDTPGRKLGIGKVLGLSEMVVEDIGSLLKFDRVRLRDRDVVEELQEWEVRRNVEELEVAVRIAKIAGRIVVFKGKKVWRLISSPMAVRLDSRLPQPTLGTTSTKEGDKRRAAILSVLKEVEGLEPATERMFHEIAYIKQKCGALLLSEFLRLPNTDKDRQFPVELLATETALIEGGIDPRVVVSLFPGFDDELREGQNGVWVYGGVRRAIEVLIPQKHERPVEDEDKPVETWNGRRDILLLLKRYLSAWRQKKGFGSVGQADEKEVFWTIDAALIRCLLALEASRPFPALRHMAGETELRTELFKMVDYPPSIECYDRCIFLLERFRRLYVLSILYQSKKMTREVLHTWRRILESKDPKVRAEFVEGEEKVAEYLLARKDRELVKEYGLWLARRNPQLGIKVFVDEKARVKWDTAQVLMLLRQDAPEAVKTYVEYLVMEKKDIQFANDLLLIYLDSIMSTLSTYPEAVTRLQSSCESYRALSLPKPTYRQFLAESSLSAAQRDGSGIGEEDWWLNRLRFLDLLASTAGARTQAGTTGTPYEVEEIIKKLKPYSNVLVAEMVLLYTMEGRHEDAFKLLVHDLRDFDGCVDHCLFGGGKIAGSPAMDRADQERFFGMFLIEALKLEHWAVRLEWVESILDRWGGWLDVVQVLSVIPDSYSVSVLSNFLISALRRLVREKSESVIVKAVRRGENLRVNAEFVDKCEDLGPTIQTTEGATSF